MNLSNEKQAQEFLDTTLSAYKTINSSLGVRVAINRCMYEGIQWLGGGMELSPLGPYGRNPTTNWKPDQNRLLATLNRVAKLIHECAAATFPDKMDVDVVPGDRETGIEGARKAQILEDATNAMIVSTGYVEAARTANFRRCIDGTHGLGWGLRTEKETVKLRKGGEEDRYTQTLKAFTFDSTKLCLDPDSQKLDLNQHEYVIYSDVWTSQRIRRELGLELDDNELQTCGELRALEMSFNAISRNSLYTSLPMFSQTKGATVHQMHVKDANGRFSTMLVGVKQPKKSIDWINWDNQESPFGGCGLPLMLMHGHRRADSMWSVSDAAMLKDDQDRLNLLATFFFRMLQKNAGYQWLVARESLDGQDPDEFRSQFNNYVSGLVSYKTGTRDRPHVPPQLIKYPDPPQFVENSMGMYEEKMRDQVHRPEITSGGYKTHVADKTYQSAKESANQVLGNRVAEDISRHEHLIGVGLGTFIKLAQEKSPSALSELARIGFDEQDFTVIAAADPYNLPEIRVRESSIRYQSKEQKESRLWAAVDRQALAPDKLRIALADMDIALDDNDKAFQIEAQKAANRILEGEEWEPRTLGEFSPMFLTAFRRATFDKKAVYDPETLARLEQAIQDQMMHEAVAVGAAQQMAEPQEMAPPGMEQGAAPEQAEAPQEADLSQLLAAIQMGSTGQTQAA